MAEEMDPAAIDQAAIDELLRQAGAAAAASDAPAAPAPADLNPSAAASSVAAASSMPDLSGSSAIEAAMLDPSSIEELLKQANFEDPASIESLPDAAAPPDLADFKLPNFQQVMQDAQVSSIDLLRDVELNVKIELGRSRMLVEDVLKLAEGSVVELDKLAGDPVDVFVNDRLVARGEVLVLNDNFCVRVNEIMAGAKEEGL